MFNSVSQQLNYYNSGSMRFGQPHTSSNGNHYFPIASQFAQFGQKTLTALPPDGPYRYYQPKSKIGQLNQRIEEEQFRRESLRKRMDSRGKEGYLSDSQRSQSSYRSNPRKEARYMPPPAEQATYRRLQSNTN